MSGAYSELNLECLKKGVSAKSNEQEGKGVPTVQNPQKNVEHPRENMMESEISLKGSLPQSTEKESTSAFEPLSFKERQARAYAEHLILKKQLEENIRKTIPLSLNALIRLEKQLHKYQAQKFHDSSVLMYLKRYLLEQAR